jgi:poly-gamma-glutamate synthesis protein (capsule biosynthesis protein)
MLGRGVAEEIGRREPASFWGDLVPVLAAADLAVANLECAITRHTVPWTRTPKTFHFRAPPDAVEVLRAGRVGAVSLANNHVLDFEEGGLRDTLRHLDTAGIAHAGAGEILERARQPAVVAAGLLRVGIAGFTDNEPGWAAGPGRPGTSQLRFLPFAGALRIVERAVALARDRGASFIVLSLHWGYNMEERPPRPFRWFARAALERGVDLIHGHSAHIFQGVEIHHGKPILYDTGEALDDYAVDPVLRNDRSFVFLADVEGPRVRALRLVPILQQGTRVGLARGRDFEDTCRRMQVLSAEMGTRAQPEPHGLTIQIPTAGV